jgi:hypothetical protein
VITNTRTMAISLLLLLAASGVFYAIAGVARANDQPPITPGSIKSSSLTETLGAAIIIAGDRSDHELQSQIRYGASQVYDILKNERGFPANRIYYLSPATFPTGLEPNADAESTFANIQAAFTTWVTSRVDATHGLLLYMFDHGGTNAMAIPGGSLFDTQIDGWLDTLETSYGLTRTIIVYEACTAGSFVTPLSQSNRIVITSTDASHSAYASSTWAIFSEVFWGSIATGDTIGKSFVDAWYNVAKSGHSTSQYPLLDDDHNSIGHPPQVVMVVIFPVAFFPNLGDGNDALDTRITGYDGPLNTPWIKIWKAPLHFYIKNDQLLMPISVLVSNNTPIKDIQVKITPPGFTPPPAPAPDQESGHMGQDLRPLLKLTDLDGLGNYSGSYVNPQGGPLLDGDYMLSVYAVGDAGISDVVHVPATVNPTGIAPTDETPPAIAITSPATSAVVSGTFNITAIADDDQGLDKVEIYVDDALVKTQDMLGYYPYPDVVHGLDTSQYSNGQHTIMAKAYDNAALTSTTEVIIDVQNAGIDGYVPAIMIGVFIMGLAWLASSRRMTRKISLM